MKVDFTRGAGPIAGALEVRDGSLVDGESRLILDPPLKVDIDAKYHMPGPLAPSTDVGATVYALEIRVDEDTGEAYLWPNVDLSGLLPGLAERQLGIRCEGPSVIKSLRPLLELLHFPDVESFLGKLSDNVTVLEPMVDPNASVEKLKTHCANLSCPALKACSCELNALLAKITSVKLILMPELLLPIAH